ncbi:carboxylesterase [Sphingobium sp. IP1]|nr:carboxylesterase [Sphingobium sp. IP1]
MEMVQRPVACAAAAVALWASLGNAAPSSAPPRLSTTSGPIRGVMRDDVRFFGGIPYAAPPVGTNRWRAPQPIRAWKTERDATGFAADCPQPRRKEDAAFPQDENCLTLNVASPDLGARKLPVLFVVHGGAYFVGSGREPFRNGMPPLVKQGVVLVAPNYRIGRLGFFAHPALTKEAPKATANFWLMDQVAALHWVRQNIARFGGDPDNVTIIGCSAGGSSINALMATPMARGLFARASAHSAGGLFNANRPLPQAQEQGLTFAQRTGVTDNGAPSLAALRRLSVAQVLAGDSGAPDFGATVDGSWLPAPLSTLFARGQIAHVPLISGSTSNEASVFGLMGFGRAEMARRFGIDLSAVSASYGLSDEAELLRQVQTDFLFTSAALGMTQLAARAGLPTRAYQFDFVPPDQRSSKPGADHCADRLFWLGQSPSADTESQALARTMSGWMLNYVRSGDPNGPGLPPWPATQDGRTNPLVIGQHIAATPDFRARQLAPWFDKWQRESGQSFGWTPTP